MVVMVFFIEHQWRRGDAIGTWIILIANGTTSIPKPIVIPFFPIPTIKKGGTTMPIMFIPTPLLGIILNEWHYYSVFGCVNFMN